MISKLAQNPPLRPERKPNRLKDYDYSQSGVYFITMCVKDKKPILSRLSVGAHSVRPPEPRLTNIGRVVEEAIRNIPMHYANAAVDKYVIMPNHVHLLLSITEVTGDECPSQQGLADNAGARCAPLRDGWACPYQSRPADYAGAQCAPLRQSTPGAAVSKVIKQAKEYVTKQCGVSIWQKSFYDHVIRDDLDYQTKWRYIDQNPMRWCDDEFYTAAE